MLPNQRNTIFNVFQFKNSFCIIGCAYGSSQQDNYDVHQRVLAVSASATTRQLSLNKLLTSAYQRVALWSEDHTNINGYDDRE